MQQQYLDYICPKCKTAYALELKAPKTHVCLKNVSQVQGKWLACGTPFPDQKQRDQLQKIQLSVMEL